MTNRGIMAAAIGAALALMGCGDSGTGPAGGASPDQARVSVGFRGASAGGSAATAPAGSGRIASNVLAQSVSLTGSNGTLTLDEIWMIVAEFELERANDDDCRGSSGENDACEKFEAPPRFVQLPLDGAEVPTVSEDVPPGLYDELEFEVEDLELDDDDDNASAADLQALFDAIRAQFPDWPKDASMLVTGSFTPTGGAPVPFRVFFEAEIEIEMEFDPPLDLSAGETATATVVVDPAVWFTLGDGTVMDLSQFEGQVVEFESELENGFGELEWDDEDD